jgi:hypothetical protein
MNLKLMELVDRYNHHTSTARAILDVLAMHGVGAVMPSSVPTLALEDLYASAKNDDKSAKALRAHLIELRKAHGNPPVEMPGAFDRDNRDVPILKAHLNPAKAVPKAKTPPKSEAKNKPKAKRVLTIEARSRIASAQRKRWEDYRNRPKA